MEEKDNVYESVHNYTKFKLVEMLIDKHKDKKIDNLNMIEQLADDVLKVLSIAGLMISFYLLLCFIQWVSEVIEERSWEGLWD